MGHLEDRFAGILLGGALGDTLGLPVEGLGPERIKKWHGGLWRQRFIAGRGMISDDTEHTLMVAQCLLMNPKTEQVFAQQLAWKLRFWLLALPAGVGFATAVGILRLLLGFPLHKSGIFSAGNGPAMRAAVIGAYWRDDPEKMVRFVIAGTRLTHTDPKAITAALAVARLTAWAMAEEPDLARIWGILDDCATRQDLEWADLCRRMRQLLEEGRSLAEFCAAIGITNGVSGYAYQTVPVAIYAFLHHFGNFEDTLRAVLDRGGDTDTTAAIAGNLAGAVTGGRALPQHWLKPVSDWPRGVPLLRLVAKCLANRSGRVRYFWPGILLRNIFFLVIVLCHGFRRLAPPY